MAGAPGPVLSPPADRPPAPGQRTALPALLGSEPRHGPASATPSRPVHDASDPVLAALVPVPARRPSAEHAATPQKPSPLLETPPVRPPSPRPLDGQPLPSPGPNGPAASAPGAARPSGGVGAEAAAPNPTGKPGQFDELPLPIIPPRRPSLPEGPPRIAVMIDDLGNNPAVDRRFAALPAPLDLDFLPIGHDLRQLTGAAVLAGDEVFLHMPMQPMGSADPGSDAILVGLGADEIGRRLGRALGRVPNAVGVNNHMGSRATSDPATMLLVMQALKRRGLMYVDSRTIAGSVAGDVALNLGMREADRDVFLDNDTSGPAIRAQLAATERIARRHGTAIAIGHPYPSTLAELTGWLPDARRRGFTFVRVSTLARQCAQPARAILASCTRGDRACMPHPAC